MTEHLSFMAKLEQVAERLAEASIAGTSVRLSFSDTAIVNARWRPLLGIETKHISGDLLKNAGGASNWSTLIATLQVSSFFDKLTALAAEVYRSPRPSRPKPVRIRRTSCRCRRIARARNRHARLARSRRRRAVRRATGGHSSVGDDGGPSPPRAGALPRALFNAREPLKKRSSIACDCRRQPREPRGAIPLLGPHDVEAVNG